ncbi:MAG TPA: molybdopterin-guanine dinucleotide biosynthesis protein B [Lacipirellula sp.]
MHRLHIIGGKNHGKTTLIVELVQELTKRNVRVGTIKHTHHRHELDVPGKDSYRHRLAGAEVVGILSPSMNAVFMPRAEAAATRDPYEAFAPLFADCQCVLVEGDVQASSPKVEVWRAELRTPPLATSDRSIMAVVTDDAPTIAAARLARSDIKGLADWVLAMFSPTLR